MCEFALIKEDIPVEFGSDVREEHVVRSEVIAIEETSHPK
jgi:hypothetical protein